MPEGIEPATSRPAAECHKPLSYDVFLNAKLRREVLPQVFLRHVVIACLTMRRYKHTAELNMLGALHPPQRRWATMLHIVHLCCLFNPQHV